MYSDKNQWYMSTPDLVDKLVKPYLSDFRGKSYLKSGPSKVILEPSAGNGAICDHLIERYGADAKQFRVIEQDPELQAILLDKKYRLVATDFLKFEDVGFTYDYVFMNPPFAEGAKHLLRAWDILESGDIACVLNAETLRNPYTEDRKRLLRVIQDNDGSIEWVGKPFKGSDQRKTDVECAIVRLTKQSARSNNIDDLEFSKLDVEHDPSTGEYQKNFLSSPSMIKTLVAQYNGARNAIIEEDKVHARYLFYVKGVGGSVQGSKDPYATQGTLNDRLESLRAKFWKHVFNATNLGQTMTTGFQIEFEQKFDRSRNLAFTEENIRGVLEMFLFGMNDILEKCAVEMFDLCTQFHDKNRDERGWKTNKAYRANIKLILPYGIRHNIQYVFHRWSMADWDSRSSRFYHDIDRVLCHMAGIKLSSLPKERTLKGAIDLWINQLNSNERGEFAEVDGKRLAYSSWRESHFFKFKIFKSGTTHLICKDKDLWALFNQTATKSKKWVMQSDYEQKG